MKRWSARVAAVALLICCTVSMIYANDFPTPQQPPDTPVVLELTNNVIDTANLTAPADRYKELADFAVTAIKQRHPETKVSTYVRPGDEKEKKPAALLISYAEADQVTLTFKSNCSVNSQFNVESVTLAERARSNVNEVDVQRYLVSDIAARWTRLNHDWSDTTPEVPKTYVAKLMAWGGAGDFVTLDVSYDRKEVKTYNQSVAARARPALNVASK